MAFATAETTTTGLVSVTPTDSPLAATQLRLLTMILFELQLLNQAFLDWTRLDPPRRDKNIDLTAEQI